MGIVPPTDTPTDTLMGMAHQILKTIITDTHTMVTATVRAGFRPMGMGTDMILNTGTDTALILNRQNGLSDCTGGLLCVQVWQGNAPQNARRSWIRGPLLKSSVILHVCNRLGCIENI